MIETMSAVTQVPGFRAVGVACGIKDSGKPDLALILGAQSCTAAAVFTSNVFKAAPVVYDMDLLERTAGKLQGVIINAGNANAVTGRQGLHDAEQMARVTETTCGLPADSIFVMSTGVIGQKMPMTDIENGIRMAGEAVRTEAGQQGQNIAQAILTTDLVPKEAFIQTEIGGKPIRIGGIAKGSGMIHPNMATMLSAIVTDAAIELQALKAALKRAVSVSFNRVTVDGDTSTNDTVLIMASSQADNTPITSSQQPEFETFATALTELCISLAKAIARDGEGATKLIEISVRGAATESEAEIAAKTIATSPLVKTALFGNDPNWGRALAAIGRSGVKVDPARVSLRLDEFQLVDLGEPLNFDAVAASNWLSSTNEIKLEVNLDLGQAEATIWTCDFSYKYVEINAEYHT